MKNLFYLLFLSFFLCTTAAFGQESKAKTFMVETGSSALFGLFPTSGTSFGVVLVEGSSILNLSFEAGYMVSERTAIKGRLGLFSLDGTSITGLMVGPKFYTGIGLFADLGVGILSAAGESAFQANGTIGYAIRLKDYINLEPSLGLLVVDGGTAGLLNMKFAMFF